MHSIVKFWLSEPASNKSAGNMVRIQRLSSYARAACGHSIIPHCCCALHQTAWLSGLYLRSCLQGREMLIWQSV